MAGGVAYKGKRGNEYTVKTSIGDDDKINLFDDADKDANNNPKTKSIVGSNVRKSINNKVSIWYNDVTYSQNDVINYNGTLYKSLQNSNLNKNPSTETSWWEDITTSAGVSFASGIIKSSSSVVNDSSLSSITDWSGSAGAYTSTITFNSAKSYSYAQSMVFYEYDGTDYIQIIPTEVKPNAAGTTMTVTMPTNNDLYLGSI